MGDPVKPPVLQLSQAKALHALNKDFCGSIPQEARASGHYEVKAPDRFIRQRVPVPDGRYRVLGSEWVLVVASGRLTHVLRAEPPEFGGPGVIEVVFDTARVERPTKGD